MSNYGKQRKRSRRRLHVETLETRRVLAGNVTAVVDDGDLEIDGDGADNDIRIDQIGLAAGEFRISSGSNVTTINGVAGPIILTGVSDDVEVALNDGNDRVLVRDASIPDDLELDGGNGDSLFSIRDTAIGDDLEVENGEGRDELQLIDSTVVDDVEIDNGDGGTGFSFFGGGTLIDDSTIGGDLKIDNGDGIDQLGIGDSVISGDVDVDNGDGAFVDDNDPLFFGSLTFIQSSLVEGKVKIKNKDGIDQYFLGGSTIDGDVKIDNGDGGVAENSFFSSVAQIGGMTFGGDLDIKNKDGVDILEMVESTVAGNFTIKNGDGGSNVDGFFGPQDGSVTRIGGVEVGGKLEISSKDGSDLVELIELAVTGKTKIKTGKGDDIVRVRDSVFAKFSADGGKDDDIFEDGGGNTFAPGSPDLKNFETII